MTAATFAITRFLLPNPQPFFTRKNEKQKHAKK
jgi:hypothetical protein